MCNNFIFTVPLTNFLFDVTEQHVSNKGIQHADDHVCQLNNENVINRAIQIDKKGDEYI